jgi:hypothetical protein
MRRLMAKRKVTETVTVTARYIYLGSASGWRSRLGPFLLNGYFLKRPTTAPRIEHMDRIELPCPCVKVVKGLVAVGLLQKTGRGSEAIVLTVGNMGHITYHTLYFFLFGN